MAIVTSSIAHAKIISIDATEALSMPGVKDYLSSDDVPGSNVYRPTRDEYVFAEQEVKLTFCHSESYFT